MSDGPPNDSSGERIPADKHERTAALLLALAKNIEECKSREQEIEYHITLDEAAIRTLESDAQAAIAAENLTEDSASAYRSAIAHILTSRNESLAIMREALGRIKATRILMEGQYIDLKARFNKSVN